MWYVRNKTIKYIFHLNISDIFFLTISFVMFIFNFYAGYVMSLSLKAIKFENIVIICGILQSLVLIFILITDWELLTLLNLFCQTLIYLFILRRFLRIYFRMKRKIYEPKLNFYNLYSKINFRNFI